MKFDIQRKMFEIQRLIFKNQTFYLKFKNCTKLYNIYPFIFKPKSLNFEQFNVETQKIKLKFQTFMFKFYGLKFQRLIIKFEIQRKSFFKFQTLFLLLNLTRKD